MKVFIQHQVIERLQMYKINLKVPPTNPSYLKLIIFDKQCF